MSDEMQVFISYARNDDVPWHTPSDAKGFVSYLHDELRHDLTDNGGTNLKLWRDVKRVSDADQFAPLLEREIRASAVLLVVLSPNWLKSAYCRRELEMFGQRWAAEGEEAVKSRIVVINKNDTPREKRPPLLQGQVGVTFYAKPDVESQDDPRPFFARGEVQDEASYYKRIEQLRTHLIRLGDTLGANDVAPPPPEKPPAAPRSGGRLIFVAQPANDMIAHYDCVVRELQGLGHAVAPERPIPADRTAEAFIDAQLAKAEMAVHLLGAKPGYTPEDGSPIVQLQLQRSALRAGPQAAGAPPLRRILWAPKTLIDEGAPDGGAVARDPIAVLRIFGGELLPGDAIDGQVRSRFVDFLKLEASRPTRASPPPPPPSNGKASIYLDHHPDDEEFGFRLAEALRAPNVSVRLPVLDGSPRDLRADRQKKLRECDAVVLCWGSAREAWICSEWDALRNWRSFQRNDRFLFRGVVAGPPPGSRKKHGKLVLEIDEDQNEEDIIDVTSDGDAMAGVATRLLRHLGQPAS